MLPYFTLPEDSTHGLRFRGPLRSFLFEKVKVEPSEQRRDIGASRALFRRACRPDLSSPKFGILAKWMKSDVNSVWKTMENCARGDVADGATGGAANYFSQRLAPE